MNTNLYTFAFYGLLATMVAVGVWVLLLRRPKAPVEGNSNTPAPADDTPPVKRVIHVPVFELLLIGVTGLVFVLFGDSYGWELDELTKPMPLIMMLSSITFLSIIVLGVKKHLEAKGNGAMYAVTLIAIIVFLGVLVTGAYLLVTELLFGDQAEEVRKTAREQVAEVWDPRLERNAVTTWDINWVVLGLLVLGALLMVALVRGFSESSGVRVPVYILALGLLVWMIPKTIITEVPEEYRLTTDDMRGAIDQLGTFINTPRAAEEARPWWETEPVVCNNYEEDDCIGRLPDVVLTHKGQESVIILLAPGTCLAYDGGDEHPAIVWFLPAEMGDWTVIQPFRAEAQKFEAQFDAPKIIHLKRKWC